MLREPTSTNGILATLRKRRDPEGDTPTTPNSAESASTPSKRQDPQGQPASSLVEHALASGDELLSRLVATVAESHTAAVRGSPGTACATCVLFKSSRDELLAHVGGAFEEVRRLRHQYDVCKERLAELESEQGDGGEGSYQLRQQVALLEDRCMAMQERMRIKESKSKAMESQVASAKAILRENVELRSQRDQLVRRVQELEGQMEKDIEAAEDAAECKITTLAGTPDAVHLETELKELRRLRVLMRFSELKKDSDRLQDVYKYAEELEVEIDRLREAMHVHDVSQVTAQHRPMHCRISAPSSDAPATASPTNKPASSPRVPLLLPSPREDRVVPSSGRLGSISANRGSPQQQLAPLPPSPSPGGNSRPATSSTHTASHQRRPQSSGGTSSVAWLLGLVRQQRSGAAPTTAARPGSGRSISQALSTSPHQQHYLRTTPANGAAPMPGATTSKRPSSRPGTAGSQAATR